jgi:hypothetical protein
MHYVTHISHRKQKHKFSITSPDARFWKPHQAHLSMKNSASMFHAPEAAECTMRPADPIGCKNTSSERVLAHFLRKRHRDHPSMKYSVSMFHAPDASECST